jgi:hypothetical protein
VQFDYAYRQSSTIVDSGTGTSMSFSPDLKRAPTFFRGELAAKLPFREAMSALHDVVISDQRQKPRDKSAYLAWRATQDEIDWATVGRERDAIATRVAGLETELRTLTGRRHERHHDFDRARTDFFRYLYEKERDLWMVLDPVVTVHPDQVAFECFSEDESSYGRLAAGYEVFTRLGERACGTTNVDYSQRLYDEFQKIRSYKSTTLEVDPGGFAVATTAEAAHKEVKIDLPESWVRGFLQVSSAMGMRAAQVELHPMDVHNMCWILRRRREVHGPRSIRFCLTPGQPVRLVFEPWGTELRCPRSIYRGAEATEIRVWGRRRLHVLERLVPVARKFTVHLLGTGMPSFYVADLGDLSFTLGLSGWTRNDWSHGGNFDLLAPREDVDDLTRRRVFEALKTHWLATPEALATELGLERKLVVSALDAWVQAGRAIYDLAGGVYRARELAREPLPVDALRFSSERERLALTLLHEGKIACAVSASGEAGLKIRGLVSHVGKRFEPSLVLDGDGRVLDAACTCNLFQQHRLRRGPCEHVLALRLAQRRGISDVLEPRPPSAPGAVAASAARAALVPPPAAAEAAPGAASEAPAAPAAPGFWKRLWSKMSGKGGAAAAPGGASAAPSLDPALVAEIHSAVAEISVTMAEIRDERAVVAAIAAACAAAKSPKGYPAAAVQALRASPEVVAIHGDDERLANVFRTAFARSAQRR